ncbi:MAG: hypothetical protein ACYDD1_14665 [Caulobacteraceae bacterium]
MIETSPIIYTSLAPSILRGSPPSFETGRSYQQKCARSWLDAGASLISVNSEEEISTLEPQYPGVRFVELKAEPTAGNPKGLPYISDILKLGHELDQGAVFGIVNSDIQFTGDRQVLSEIFRATIGGAAFCNRVERHPVSHFLSLPYLYGYDFVVLDNQFISPKELIGFPIGVPWWDYLLLYLLAARDVPLCKLAGPVISHLTHATAWSGEAWSHQFARVATKLREMSDEEGPTAAILGQICRHFEAGVLPGFVADQIPVELGTLIGNSMVSYIAERCEKVLWFEMDWVNGERLPRGKGNVSLHFPATKIIASR